jgi:enamine deaminase RidA (YjgF/YER057c/UK114 family)
MQDPRSAIALRETLQFVAASDIPSRHKGVLIDCLTQSLRASDAAQIASNAPAAGAAWQPGEIAQLQSFLSGKIARSWQHADEVLVDIASQLHRSMRDVRAKAIEIGHGEGVDYFVARVRSQAPQP